MAREFFKDLPNTTTPLTASRLNGLLNGDEALGSIVVDDVNGKNLFDKGSMVAGDRINAQPTIRISSRQGLYLEPGTYTFSTNLDTSVYRYEINTISSPAPVSSYDTLYGSGWKTTSTLTFTIDNNTKGYFNLGVARINNSSLTISDISSANFQLEKGSTATEYAEYKQPVKKTSIGVKEDAIFYANDFKCKNLLDEALLSTSAKSTGITYDGTKVYSTNPSNDTRYWNYANSNYYFTLEPGTYTISLKFQHKITNSSGGLFRFYKTDDTFFANFNANNVDYASKTFELSEKTDIGLYFKLYDGQVNIQIEKGSEATSYIPYKNFDNTPIITQLLGDTTLTASTSYALSNAITNYKYIMLVLTSASTFENANRQYIPVEQIQGFNNLYRCALSVFQSTSVYMFADMYFADATHIYCNTLTRGTTGWAGHLKVYGIK